MEVQNIEYHLMWAEADAKNPLLRLIISKVHSTIIHFGYDSRVIKLV